MRNMIVAPQPVAAEAGARVLMKGGNAIDAAVTAGFVQGVISPHMCGIGGYILLNLHLADRPDVLSLILDAPALAGSRVSEGMWEHAVIGPNPDGWGFFLEDKVNDLGYQAICVPGAVRGYQAMLARWGTYSWEQVILPAARIAEEGFVVDTNLANGWGVEAPHPEGCSLLDYVKGNEAASRIYLKDGETPYQAGDRLRNPDLGRTLRRLAHDGPDDFYLGTLAGRISDDLAAGGSFLTAADLAAYQLRDPQPVIGEYRGFTIASTQAPHGGPTLVEILNILENCDMSRLEHNSADYIYTVSMAMKAAFADRNRYLADPDFVEVPLEWMVSRKRGLQWWEHIEGGRPITVSITPPEHPDTTQVTVVDARGNCASLTHSLGMSSGTITPGLGFMYNNSMVNFHPNRGHPNSIAPGKGRTTGMTPTIVYKDGHPVLVIGAPGATRIITAILQVIINVLDFGMSISDAVLAPRFDCQVDVIRCHARIPEYVCAEVRKRHPIERLPRSHGGLALVHAITISPQGHLAGAADPGGGGMPLEV